jgi:hypothetical protein
MLHNLLFNHSLFISIVLNKMGITRALSETECCVDPATLHPELLMLTFFFVYSVTWLA